ncbi:GTPase-activating protein [Gurleya vavrai]
MDQSQYFSKKSDSLSKILSEPVIDLYKLKKACWGGIPSNHRAKCWRIFLRTVNLTNESYFTSIKHKNEKYESKIKNFKIDNKIKHQIEIDIFRIDNSYKIIENTDYTKMYINILSLYASLRPAVGYVQGMSDILIPFVFTFVNDKDNNKYAESSIFYCFSRFIDNLQENYIDFQKGIIKNIKKMKGVIEVVEPGLMRHMNLIGLDFHMFAFRWFNCFFVREFDKENVFIVFDTLFASRNENFAVFARFFAATLLCSFKNEIIGNDLSSNLLFIQSIDKKEFSVKDLQILLSTAYVNQCIFHE